MQTIAVNVNWVLFVREIVLITIVIWIDALILLLSCFFLLFFQKLKFFVEIMVSLTNGIFYRKLALVVNQISNRRTLPETQLFMIPVGILLLALMFYTVLHAYHVVLLCYFLFWILMLFLYVSIIKGRWFHCEWWLNRIHWTPLDLKHKWFHSYCLLGNSLLIVKRFCV